MKCDVCGSEGVKRLLLIDQTDNIKDICKNCSNELDEFQKKLLKAELAVIDEENKRLRGFSHDRLIKTRTLQIGRMKENHINIMKKYFKLLRKSK